MLALLLALALPLALSPPSATSRPPGGAEVALAALEALVASGEGQLSRGELGALVAQVAAGRAQCPREPCGECPSVPAVLALAGGDTAGLDVTELSWLGAAVVATLRDPPATCGDPDGDTHGDTHGDTEATTGSWASRVLALHREFATDVTADDVTGDVADSVAGRGGPGLREVAELLAAIEPNYRGDNGHRACLDARGVLAATAGVSPRVGTGRVLVALGVLVLRGRQLCPGDIGDIGDIEDRGDTASPRCGDSDSHCGDSSTWHLGDTGDTDTRHGDTAAWRCGDAGDIDACRGDTSDADTPLGDTEGHQGPTAPGLWSGDSGDNVTVPTATNGTEAEEQLSVTQRYLLGTLTALALALVPLVALALVLCPRCSRCPHGGAAGCRRCRRCRLCPPRWWRPLLDGLAAGALSGDALLHVLPEALGVHSHAGGSQEDHGGSHGPPWELLGVLGGLYGGFVLERLLGGWGHPPEEVKDGDPAPDPAQSTEELTNHGSGGAQALLLSAGGAVHRLADGLALGSAFVTSGSAGAAAGAGLALHELPRALGDALVLSQSGLGTRRVVALAVAAALPVVPGVVAGVALGTEPAVRSWLAALGGGFLLHLALCHMVPAMLSVRSPRPWALLVLQSAGLLGGWGLLLLLALGEE